MINFKIKSFIKLLKNLYLVREINSIIKESVINNYYQYIHFGWTNTNINKDKKKYIRCRLGVGQ